MHYLERLHCLGLFKYNLKEEFEDSQENSHSLKISFHFVCNMLANFIFISFLEIKTQTILVQNVSSEVWQTQLFNSGPEIQVLILISLGKLFTSLRLSFLNYEIVARSHQLLKTQYLAHDRTSKNSIFIYQLSFLLCTQLFC